jgi:Ca-activated chloride channel family protein
MGFFIDKKSVVFLLFLLIAGNVGLTQPQEEKRQEEKTRILFILDASRSMLGNWQGEEKFVMARRLLSKVLDSLKGVENVDFALRVYGHRKHYPPQDCNDTKLEVPFSADRPIERIKYRLKHIQPNGTTPIAESLAKASGDFTPCADCRNIVILITDGKEECDGDICEVSEQLQKEGIILKPFIIGIGNDFKESFDCAGTYFNAADKKQFSDALNYIITRVLSKTTLQVNLLDVNGNPLETNVVMQFVDKTSNKVMYNFVHTLNVKGLPDTLFINPLSDYKLIVNTLPPVVVDNVSLVEGKHNTVSVDCPQGVLRVDLNGRIPADFDPPILVNDTKNNLINVQYLNDGIKYLSGKYNVKILTLPPVNVNGFEIVADNTNIITIDTPGVLVVQKNIRVYGAIFRLEKDGQHFVVGFNENNARQEKFYLQPGKYRIVYRSRFQNQSVFTVTKEVTVKSSESTTVRF